MFWSKTQSINLVRLVSYLTLRLNSYIHKSSSCQIPKSVTSKLIYSVNSLWKDLNIKTRNLYCRWWVCIITKCKSYRVWSRNIIIVKKILHFYSLHLINHCALRIWYKWGNNAVWLLNCLIWHLNNDLRIIIEEKHMLGVYVECN